MKSQKWESLLAITEGVSEQDVAEIEEMLKEVDLKNVAMLLKELSDNADSISELIRLSKALKESGTLAILESVLEMTDENFNALLRPDAVRALGNLMMLVYLLSSLNNAMLMKAAEGVPPCLDKAVNSASENMRPIGILEAIRILRSPEVGAALRGLYAALSCLAKRQ